MNKVLVIGCGGLAREFSDFFSDQVEVVGFSGLDGHDYKKYNMPGKIFTNDVTPAEVGTDQAVIAIGSPQVRHMIYEMFMGRGFTYPSFIHSSAMVSAKAVLDEGVVISPKSVICANARLRKFTYVNLLCSIGHEAVVGPFVHINSGTHLGGGSIIGEKTLVGSGSFVLQKVEVGDNATIAPCSSVLSSVSSGATVLGNPALRMRVLEKKQ